MSSPAPLRMLASVRDRDEALFAARLGADVIDLKEPRAGTLGAVPFATQREIVAALQSYGKPVSATVGDLPCDAPTLHDAIEYTAASGVDFVKFGIFAAGREAARELRALDRLRRAAQVRSRIVAVLLADRLADGDAAIALARDALGVSGMAGVMLDTVGKTAGSLPDAMSIAALARFVAAVQAAGGFAGLAGSLRHENVLPLAATGADLLGFRGALCGGDRTGGLDRTAFQCVRDQVSLARAAANRSALAA